ncbi:hypothetical protein P170DRAFT_142130 [Aspergillus steynii IBT 23096]|uniref:Uncharacterized protein n=1 Tax=Aspergillus steynii IBT 23096 TaxID=1392250 RepID=A0A2I2GBS7_9EURO|nr:uncharacterized protein P170DRAFT_142130 [Aspergillus steynii IBT 23096]PLB50341.1 hypothetical protein P170DRAFT_142130 [Aspergillus steynii IBT 23096]
MLVRRVGLVWGLPMSSACGRHTTSGLVDLPLSGACRSSPRSGQWRQQNPHESGKVGENPITSESSRLRSLPGCFAFSQSGGVGSPGSLLESNHSAGRSFAIVRWCYFVVRPSVPVDSARSPPVEVKLGLP